MIIVISTSFYLLEIFVNFSHAIYLFVENNGSVQAELVFSIPASFDITVQVIVSDISAIGVNNTECTIVNSENDYTMGLYNVTFPANVTVGVINIPVCDDIVLEEDESFSISVVSQSLIDNVTVGNVDQAIVVIVNDDCKLCM